jgi:hypothetical protein
MNEPILTTDQIKWITYNCIQYYIILAFIIVQQFGYMLENIKDFMIHVNTLLKLVNCIWVNQLHTLKYSRVFCNSYGCSV